MKQDFHKDSLKKRKNQMNYKLSKCIKKRNTIVCILGGILFGNGQGATIPKINTTILYQGSSC